MLRLIISVVCALVLIGREVEFDVSITTRWARPRDPEMQWACHVPLPLPRAGEAASDRLELDLDGREERTRTARVRAHPGVRYGRNPGARMTTGTWPDHSRGALSRHLQTFDAHP